MKTLYVKDRDGWRKWLEKNGASASEIWLIYYKKDSGKPRISYDAAVEEALCFGWIDSTAKRLDVERYAQRFTPRKPASNWSASNIERVERLIRDGRMTGAGLKAFRPGQKRDASDLPKRLPKDIEGRFRAQKRAWENFNAFPPSYRRLTIGWVASAKKDETRLKRLSQLIETAKNSERIKFM